MSITPKILKASVDNLRAVPATLSKDHQIGEKTLEFASIEGWAEYCSFVLYSVDGKGRPIEETAIDCIGKVSGNAVEILEITAGADDNLPAETTKAIVDETAGARNRLVEALRSLLNDDGTPKVETRIEGGNLEYKSDAGWRPLSTVPEVDTKIDGAKTELTGKITEAEGRLSGKIADNKTELISAIEGAKTEATNAIATAKTEVKSELTPQINAKQNKLTAGDGINIEGNVISAVGGSGGGGGKRFARVVIGTSTAGYTESEVDYLCNGTDDQAKINEAINALPENGGEIRILDGTYNITAPVLIQSRKNVRLNGAGGATILKRKWNSTQVEGVVEVKASENVAIVNMHIDNNLAEFNSENNKDLNADTASASTLNTGKGGTGEDESDFLSEWGELVEYANPGLTTGIPYLYNQKFYDETKTQTVTIGRDSGNDVDIVSNGYDLWERLIQAQERLPEGGVIKIRAGFYLSNRKMRNVLGYGGRDYYCLPPLKNVKVVGEGDVTLQFDIWIGLIGVTIENIKFRQRGMSRAVALQSSGGLKLSKIELGASTDRMEMVTGSIEIVSCGKNSSIFNIDLRSFGDVRLRSNEFDSTRLQMSQNVKEFLAEDCQFGKRSYSLSLHNYSSTLKKMVFNRCFFKSNGARCVRAHPGKSIVEFNECGFYNYGGSAYGVVHAESAFGHFIFNKSVIVQYGSSGYGICETNDGTAMFSESAVYCNSFAVDSTSVIADKSRIVATGYGLGNNATKLKITNSETDLYYINYPHERSVLSPIFSAFKNNSVKTGNTISLQPNGTYTDSLLPGAMIFEDNDIIKTGSSPTNIMNLRFFTHNKAVVFKNNRVKGFTDQVDGRSKDPSWFSGNYFNDPAHPPVERKDDRFKCTLKMVQNILRSGDETVVRKLLPIGTEILDTWTNTFNGEVHQMPWIIVHIGNVQVRSGATKLGVTLMRKNASLDYVQFDASEPSNPNDYRSRFGNNRYLYSAIHQWLNTDKPKGTWWTSQHQYDAKSDYADTRDGYMKGCSKDLLEVVQEVKFNTQKPSVDGGGVDAIFGKFFLPSMENLNFVVGGYGKPVANAENGVWDYYKAIGSSTDAENPLRTFDRFIFLRSFHEIIAPDVLFAPINTRQLDENYAVPFADAGATGGEVWLNIAMFSHKGGLVYSGLSPENETYIVPACVITSDW